MEKNNPITENQRKKPELLMPAGSLEKLKTAFLYGADAVYAGVPDLCMRTKSEFDLEELLEGIAYAHALGKKIYLTLNLFSHNSDIAKLPTFLQTVRTLKPDGLIIADPGVFQYVKEQAPELELHISTQANVCSYLTVDYWKKQGASLVVLAREVSFAELKEIREKCPDVKLEAFVHGSMCMTYSGRCLLSNFMAERRSNQGNCAHSCRWNYKMHVKLKDGTMKEIEINDQNKDMFEFMLEEEFRPGEMMSIVEDERGSYIMNSKDLCLMPVLNQYMELGIDSFKIEGRNKTNYYAALAAHAYRRAIDDWARDPDSWSPEPYLAELDGIQNRGYTMAFHDGRLTNSAHNYESGKSVAQYEFAGYIVDREGDDLIFEIKNTAIAGEVLEFVSPHASEVLSMTIREFEDAKTGEKTLKVSAGQGKRIRISSEQFFGYPREGLQYLLPVLTVARKQKLAQDLKVKEGDKSRGVGVQAQSQKIPYYLVEEQLEKGIQQAGAPAAKAPQIGASGCCGKGCNGCLVFWHDPSYAKAREVYERQKRK